MRTLVAGSNIDQHDFRQDKDLKKYVLRELARYIADELITSGTLESCLERSIDERTGRVNFKVSLNIESNPDNLEIIKWVRKQHLRVETKDGRILTYTDD